MILYKINSEGYSDAYSYRFQEIYGDMQDGISQMVVPVLIPNKASWEMKFVRISGQERLIRFDFKITDSGQDDLADGTAADIDDNNIAGGVGSHVVTTIKDQKRWLLRHMYDPKMDAKFYLHDETWYPDLNPGDEPLGMRCILKSIKIQHKPDEPNLAFATIELSEGQNMVQ